MKKIFKNMIMVAMSNISTIVSGVLVGFLLPKMMSIDSYGYYKTFTLYITYTGFFSLGIIDGIVLKYGGNDYSELDSRKFRGLFRWYLLVHGIFFFCICALALLFNDKNYIFICFAVAVFMVVGNITGYFQQLSQITQRFKEYSIRKLLQSTLNIILVCGLFLFARSGNEINYKLYTALWVLVNALLALWYLITYKDIVVGDYLTLKETKSELINLVKNGFPLLFANLCSTLILTLDRQFVNVLFSNAEYAVYAFAYNMLSLVTVATSAISTVLFPVLKRTTKENLKKNYSDLITLVLVFVFGALIVYFPLNAFITWFLPKYAPALIIFRVIFPGLAISSAVTVVMHNYYKTLGANLEYFKKSIIILFISAFANGIAYMIFKTTVSISVASVFTMLIWYLYIEQYFVHNYRYDGTKNLLYMVGMMLLFYAATCIPYLVVSGFVYFLLYVFFTLFIQKDLLSIVKSLVSKE